MYSQMPARTLVWYDRRCMSMFASRVCQKNNTDYVSRLLLNIAAGNVRKETIACSRKDLLVGRRSLKPLAVSSKILAFQFCLTSRNPGFSGFND